MYEADVGWEMAESVVVAGPVWGGCAPNKYTGVHKWRPVAGLPKIVDALWRASCELKDAANGLFCVHLWA